jgi:hypothetical protein
MPITLGDCPNGCTKQELYLTSSAIHTMGEPTGRLLPVQMRRRGSRVKCPKCGYSVKRYNLIVAQHKGK